MKLEGEIKVEYSNSVIQGSSETIWGVLVCAYSMVILPQRIQPNDENKQVPARETKTACTGAHNNPCS
jgi:hypothetical protein